MHNIKLYLPLCWLKANPFELPNSIDFFKQNLWFYFIVELFIQANMIDPSEAFVEVALETALTLSFVWVILLLHKTSDFYVPIATAVLFGENVIAIFGVPVVVWLTVSDDLLSYYCFAILCLWDFAIITYIIRKVLSINIAASIVISIFYFFITYGGAYGITLLLF